MDSWTIYLSTGKVHSIKCITGRLQGVLFFSQELLNNVLKIVLDDFLLGNVVDLSYRKGITKQCSVHAQ